jgi:hypothetical protein
MLDRFLNSRVGIIIISIIWGLGLATLFKSSCQGNDCKIIEYRGPPTSNAEYYWKYDGDANCYQWVPYLAKCESGN